MSRLPGSAFFATLVFDIRAGRRVLAPSIGDSLLKLEKHYKTLELGRAHNAFLVFDKHVTELWNLRQRLALDLGDRLRERAVKE